MSNSKPATSWGDITSYKVDEHEGGYDVMDAYHGLPLNCTVERCSGNWLVEIVPLLKESSAVIISRFGCHPVRQIPFPELGYTEDRYVALAGTLVVDGVLACDYDDVIIYGDLPGNAPECDSYVMLWMDRSGKCSAARIQKSNWPGLTLEEFKSFHIDSLHASYQEGWIHNDEFKYAVIVEIPGEFKSITYP